MSSTPPPLLVVVVVLLPVPLSQPGKDKELTLDLPARRFRHGRAGKEDRGQWPLDVPKERAVSCRVRDAAQRKLKSMQKIELPLYYAQIGNQVGISPAGDTKQPHLLPEVGEEGLRRAECLCGLFQQLFCLWSGMVVVSDRNIVCDLNSSPHFAPFAK